MSTKCLQERTRILPFTSTFVPQFFLLIKDMMHMKKKMKVLIALVCLGAVYLVTKEMENKPISDLAFQNIEALAQGEGPENHVCFNYGDIDCYGVKVDYKMTGLNLDPERETE